MGVLVSISYTPLNAVIALRCVRECVYRDSNGKNINFRCFIAICRSGVSLILREKWLSARRRWNTQYYLHRSIW